MATATWQTNNKFTSNWSLVNCAITKRKGPLVTFSSYSPRTVGATVVWIDHIKLICLSHHLSNCKIVPKCFISFLHPIGVFLATIWVMSALAGNIKHQVILHNPPFTDVKEADIKKWVFKKKKSKTMEYLSLQTKQWYDCNKEASMALPTHHIWNSCVKQKTDHNNNINSLSIYIYIYIS